MSKYTELKRQRPMYEEIYVSQVGRAKLSYHPDKIEKIRFPGGIELKPEEYIFNENKKEIISDHLYVGAELRVSYTFTQIELREVTDDYVTKLEEKNALLKKIIAMLIE